MPAIGRNVVTTFGEQDSKGTAASTLEKLLATSNNLEDNVNTTASEALTGNRFTADNYVTSFGPGGGVDAEVSRQTLAKIIKHAIGAEDTAPEDLGAGTGPYKHIFTPDNKLTNWLTFLKYFTDASYHELYKDCKISQLTFNLTAQSIITYSLDLLSIQSENIDGAPTATINENTGEKLFSWQAKAIWKAGETEENEITSIVDEFSFTHNNNVDDGDYGLSQERRSLDVQGSEHTNSLTTQFDKARYMDMKTDLKQNNIIPVRIEIGLASDDTSPFLAIDYPKMKLTQAQANVGGPDKVTVDLQGTALWDNTAGTNINVEIVDDQTTEY